MKKNWIKMFLANTLIITLVIGIFWYKVHSTEKTIQGIHQKKISSNKVVLKELETFFHEYTLENYKVSLFFVSPKELPTVPEKNPSEIKKIDENTVLIVFSDKDITKYPCMISTDAFFEGICKSCQNIKLQQAGKFPVRLTQFTDEKNTEIDYIITRTLVVLSVFTDAIAHREVKIDNVYLIEKKLAELEKNHPQAHLCFTIIHSNYWGRYGKQFKTSNEAKQFFAKMDKDITKYIEKQCKNHDHEDFVKQSVKTMNSLLFNTLCPDLSQNNVDKLGALFKIELNKAKDRRLLNKQITLRTLEKKKNQQIESLTTSVYYLLYSLMTMAFGILYSSTMQKVEIFQLRRAKMQKETREKQRIQKKLHEEKKAIEAVKKKAHENSIQHLRDECILYNLSSPVLEKENEFITEEEKQILHEVLESRKNQSQRAAAQRNKLIEQIGYGLDNIEELLDIEERDVFLTQYDEIMDKIALGNLDYKQLRTQIIDLNKALKKAIKRQ